MSTTMVVAIVTGAIVGVGSLVAAGVWLMRWLRARAQDAERRARALVEGEQVSLLDGQALSFGIESAGVTQVRGNGCLLLTPTRLVFAMWAPKRELCIPRDRVEAIERPRSHLGKSQGVELLKVIFRDDAGDSDAVAWRVRDLDAWVAALDTEDT